MEALAAMVMKGPLLATVAALGLSACAQGYGYAYDYDPYLGPRGHYVGPYEPRPAAYGLACSRVVYSAPISAGYRGAYVAGPYCASEAGTP